MYKGVTWRGRHALNILVLVVRKNTLAKLQVDIGPQKLTFYTFSFLSEVSSLVRSPNYVATLTL